MSLVRHHRRQQWLAETIQVRLNADLNAIATAGSFGHPEDLPQQGLVPGLTDWEYYFHGRGCCLTHRLTGESLDVDFYDETGDWFDVYFFINYLESLKAPPEFAERRLIDLHPSLTSIRLSFEELVETGLLERHPERSVLRLPRDSFLLEEPIEALERRWIEPGQRPWIAAVLGDWLLVEQELQAFGPPPASISARAARCHDLRFARLKRLFLEPDARSDVLEAIADLDHPELPDLLERALESKPSGMTSAARKIITRRSEPHWTKAVYRLFRRVDPNGDIPEPHLWKMCAEYLARNGDYSTEVKRSLKTVRRHELGDAALLAMEYAPELALSLFRRALRSAIPYNRTTAAAALAIIDEPWSRAELFAVLRESDDQSATAECRVALMLTHHPEAHQCVANWEGRNPHEPESGPFISMQEMMLRSRGNYLQYEMEKLHDRVLPMAGNRHPHLAKGILVGFGRLGVVMSLDHLGYVSQCFSSHRRSASSQRTTRKWPQHRAIHRREVRCPLAISGWFDMGSSPNFQLPEHMKIKLFRIKAFHIAGGRDNDLHPVHRGFRRMLRRGRSTTRSPNACWTVSSCSGDVLSQVEILAKLLRLDAADDVLGLGHKVVELLVRADVEPLEPLEETP